MTTPTAADFLRSLVQFDSQLCQGQAQLIRLLVMSNVHGVVSPKQLEKDFVWLSLGGLLLKCYAPSGELNADIYVSNSGSRIGWALSS